MANRAEASFYTRFSNADIRNVKEKLAAFHKERDVFTPPSEYPQVFIDKSTLPQSFENFSIGDLPLQVTLYDQMYKDMIITRTTTEWVKTRFKLACTRFKNATENKPDITYAWELIGISNEQLAKIDGVGPRGSAAIREVYPYLPHIITPEDKILPINPDPGTVMRKQSEGGSTPRSLLPDEPRVSEPGRSWVGEQVRRAVNYVISKK